ncbi:MAG: type VI secretion system-associated FHA domain protein TagH [Gammaproteobacteria bacterium]|nr:type VI secretion system-associated FHA domain protein TagH [Gammaproteobacteria bacterium]MDH5312017.1 type VI secretion system-associated FHA domain protein TagH [Gammaproteobacteria bacterium]
MGLVIEVTSEQKDILGDDYVRDFSETGGTIGRSLQNDWILPDPDRYISGRHATIDCRSGAYYLVDVSTNGIYVNDDAEPLGKGKTRRLFDGDRLRMGDWEFLVKIDGGEDLDVPELPPETALPPEMEQRIPEQVQKSGVMLLDEEELTGDDAFQAAIFGEKPRASSRPGKRKSRQPEPILDTDETGVGEALPAEGTLFEAFLEGLGVDPRDVHSTVDQREAMINMGRVMRELVSGITDLLVCRTNVKSMFRLDQTTVLPRRNNPLKLSASIEDSLMQLLVGKEGEYLAPLDAVKEVCRDLRFHHDAVVGAMAAAIGDFLDRLEPDELRQSFDRSIGRLAILKSLNQFKYWQMYSDLYPILIQQGNGPFPQQLGEDFVRAYEKHIAECKRLEHVVNDKPSRKRAAKRDPEPVSFGDTQRLDRPAEEMIEL